MELISSLDFFLFALCLIIRNPVAFQQNQEFPLSKNPQWTTKKEKLWIIRYFWLNVQWALILIKVLQLKHLTVPWTRIEHTYTECIGREKKMNEK